MMQSGLRACHRMPFVRSSLVLLALIIICSFSFQAFGQVATGSLSGTVQDVTGAVIPNATVVMTNELNQTSRQTVSNNAGFFNFAAVQPGSYTVTISAPNFANWVLKNISFNQAENRAMPTIAMKAGAKSETVEVTSDMMPVPVDTAESRLTLNNRMISELAIQGRNASELIKIMPGMGLNRGLGNSAWDSLTTATNTGPIGQYSASGSQPYGGVSMTSDGANIVDIGNMGTQVANINQDQ